MKQLIPDQRHSHYWTEYGQLFESYSTLRGLRYRKIMNVRPDTPDMERIKIGQSILNRFEQEYDQYNKPGEVLQ